MSVSPKKACRLFLILVSVVACNTSDPDFNAPVFPERIQFLADRYYPEGITYAPSFDKFLVSSIRQGKVGIVDQNGRYTDMITNDTLLISSIGMKVRDGKLYVCNGDIGASIKSKVATTRNTAGLFIYDLATRQSLRRIDLAKLLPNTNHFANDIAFDDAGNAYVTDSFAPVIYKVPADTTSPAILVNFGFAASTQVFNLNGIVYHPDKYLIVVKSNDGALFKVDLTKANTFTQIQNVDLHGNFSLPGGDGMVLYNNDLYVVHGQNKVSLVRSTDGWKTASTIKTDSVGYDQATTNVAVNGKIFTLNGRIGEISAAAMAMDTSQLKAKEYSIQQFK